MYLCRRWSGSKWAATWGWEASRGCKESDCAANLRGERPEVVVRRGGRGGGTWSLLRRAAGAGAERNGRRRKKERLWGFGSPRTRARRGEESARGATGVALPDERRVARPSRTGGVAKRGGHSARGRGRWGMLRRDAWRLRRPGGGLGAAQHDGRAAYGTGGGKQRSGQVEEEKDWFANSENFRDPDVNQR